MFEPSTGLARQTKGQLCKIHDVKHNADELLRRVDAEAYTRAVVNSIEQNASRPSFHKVRTNQCRHATVLRTEVVYARLLHRSAGTPLFFHLLRDVRQLERSVSVQELKRLRMVSPLFDS